MTLHTAFKTQDNPLKTREEWLNHACVHILDLIMPHVSRDKLSKNSPFPTIKVSLGFPFRNSKAIGQCFVRDVSTQAYNEIFINPINNDSATILHILTHEVIHAIDNCASGHKGFFAKTARAVGLEGKLTATHAGPELVKRLNVFTKTHGPIPHAAMDVEASTTIKKQTTRMHKLECTGCGFIARTSNKWVGRLPAKAICPLCGERKLVKG